MDRDGGTVTARLISLCIDANDMLSQARFWAAALGWNIYDANDDVGLVPTDSTGFGVLSLRRLAVSIDSSSRSDGV